MHWSDKLTPHSILRVADFRYTKAEELRQTARELNRRADKLELSAIHLWSKAEKESAPCSSTVHSASSSD